MLNTLFTGDVRQTLDQFRRSVDQMFDNFYGYQTQPAGLSAAGERTWAFSPVLESGWNDNFLNLRAILPGVNEKDLKVSVQNNQLILEGERKAPEGLKKNTYTQLAYGKFYTALTLPTGLDTDHIHCELHNGILDIRMPIMESSKPKQIEIKTGEGRKSIGS